MLKCTMFAKVQILWLYINTSPSNPKKLTILYSDLRFVQCNKSSSNCPRKSICKRQANELGNDRTVCINEGETLGTQQLFYLNLSSLVIRREYETT